jgi:hypothetical protein
VKSFFVLSASAVLGLSVGCMQFRPTGPLAEPGEMQAARDRPAEIVPDTQDLPKIAMTDGPPPPAPTQLIAADDISASTSAEAVKKLTAEIEHDRNAAADFPNYSKISKVKMK